MDIESTQGSTSSQTISATNKVAVCGQGDAVLGANTVSCLPQEAVPRFQEIVNMGVRNFVWPANMPDAMHFFHELAQKVIANVK